MGHGIFPNYGMRWVRSWQHLLSKKEMIDVYYTKHKKKFTGKEKEEEDIETPKKKR